jgi:hypothetical protein
VGNATAFEADAVANVDTDITLVLKDIMKI